MRTGSRAFAVFVLVLFFVSGFTGLVYQVFWLKKLALLFGNTSNAAAVTLASFFLGMAGGNAVWGRQSVKARYPLRTYAFLEAGIALGACLYFFLFDAYYFIYPFLFQLFGNHPSLFITVKLVLAMVILFPPAFFMGGTLPLMSQYWVRGPDSLGRTVSFLYAVNTLGAALGAYTAGFHLPLLFGFRNGYILNIIITSIVAFAAWWIGRDRPFLTLPVRQNKSIHSKSENYIKHFPTRIIWILAFLSGFVALSLEVLWTRMFTYFLLNISEIPVLKIFEYLRIEQKY